MPVAGITPGLLEIGKIKIGRKGEWTESAGGVKFRKPEKLDHFEIVQNIRNDEGDYLPDTELMESLKSSSKARVDAKGNIIGLPIRLLYDDLDLNFPTRYVSYAGSVLSWWSNDGVTMHTRDGRELPFDPAKVDAKYTGSDKGKINGKLSVIIDGAGSFGGCWTFRTTSFNTVKSVLGSLIAIKTAAGGRLAFLPLMLTIQPKSTVIPTTGKQTTVHVVSVIWPGSVESLQKTSIEMAKKNQQFLIEMKSIEDEARTLQKTTPDETDAEFVEEFMPEEAEKAGPPPAVPKNEEQKAEDGVEDETPNIKENGEDAKADAWIRVAERADEHFRYPEQVEAFVKWAQEKFELEWLAKTNDEVFANGVKQYLGQPPYGDNESSDQPPYDDNESSGDDVTEDVPPNKGKTFNYKNEADPADPANWINLGSGYKDYVEAHIEQINAASLKTRLKARGKWNRLQYTKNEECPVSGEHKVNGGGDFLHSELEPPEDEIKEKTEEHDEIEGPPEPETEAEDSDETKPAVPVSHETLVKIVMSKKAMAINDMLVWNELLAPYNVKTAKDLTEEQAQKFVAKLQEVRDNPDLLPT